MPSTLLLAVDAIALAFVAILSFWLVRREQSRLPLPPGPPTPKLIGWLIGNVLDLPKKRQWLAFTGMRKQYGRIVHFRAFNEHTIVLNGLKEANELMHVRGGLYSGRRQKVMMNELMGQNWGVTPLQYGPDWRIERKLLHERFHRNAISQYAPIQERYTQDLMTRIKQEPGGFEAHIKRWAASIVVFIGYGFDLNEDKDDWYVKTADLNNHYFSLGVQPFMWLVDSVPFLKYLPDWTPGIQFHKIAKESRAAAHNIVDIPYERTRQMMDDRNAVPSFASHLMQTQLNPASVDFDRMEWHIKGTTAALYRAGQETTTNTLICAIFAAALCPEAQRKAQAELDNHLIPGRTPCLSDRTELPFVHAFALEVMRWFPTVPLGIPHMLLSDQDDVYEGYRIPKGALIVANAWAILHDEQIYKDPYAFRPERFLDDMDHAPELDPREAGVFGFGRRICPGQYLADASVWLGVANLLSAFEISGAIDTDGKAIDMRSALCGASQLVTYVSIYFIPLEGLVHIIRVSLADGRVRSNARSDNGNDAHGASCPQVLYRHRSYKTHSTVDGLKL
ncbi:cytochrome P450 [Punctularia strigosozonata HHB-11173 SS5]|uniref:Cytochrome P450 n=1 Tax=Punctularia strigosozonata (strain HHB-11173) TaxID=741275 RepID=R7S111_PUNST|nr:cytochrome P450 [Punctularia strigosozonata HHB-11173 SS5]EIN03482.1 cytochrome P450 [Punctularia strigosozonata HHB-11173 SS5]